jgi:TetR/AcrR family transcriptional regulator, fatty acid metabolism regulator protein
MVSVKKKWKEVKRQRLLDAAVAVVSREGTVGLTMDNVAREAGVAKGTLYVYFKSKQELLKAAIEAIIQPNIEELIQILSAQDSPKTKLKAMTLRHLAYYEDHRDFFRVFVHDRMTYLARLKRYRSSRFQDFVDSVAHVIEEGIEEGRFRPIDAQKLAALLVECDIAMIHQRLLSDRPGSVSSDAALITDVFLHGIERPPQ